MDPSIEVVTLSPGNWIAIVGIAATNIVIIASVLWRASAKWSAFEVHLSELTKAIERLAEGPLAQHEVDIRNHDRRITVIETRWDQHNNE